MAAASHTGPGKAQHRTSAVAVVQTSPSADITAVARAIHFVLVSDSSAY